jgi:hypothetical protein
LKTKQDLTLRSGRAIALQMGILVALHGRIQEAVIVAFRCYTLLPLDDCLYALQPTIPHLTRSSLHRCLQRHGIGRLLDVEGDRPAKKKFKSYPFCFFHIDSTWS